MTSVRRLLPLAAVGFALLAGTALAGPSGRRAQPFSPAGLASGPASFRDAVLTGSRARRLQAVRRAGEWGGAVTASDGEVVQVLVSDSYPVDPALTQSLADFVVQLFHGDELAKAVFLVTPLDEIASICGPQAGGCYDPDSETIVVPGEDLPDGTSKETILVHEYGHHVARNRVNPPWSAEDWGPKRWASDEHVCARAAAGTAFPGDEGANYALNPGEAFAETYRLLNFDKQAWPTWTTLAPWNADASFYPDSAALAAAEEDVVDPWTGPAVGSWSGRIASPARPARRLLAAALDGSASARLTSAPPGASIAFVDASSGRVLAQGGRRVSFAVCGQRRLALVVRARTPGRFGVLYATP